MNNKGFAISGMLYGILLLFMMVLLSLLYVLVTRINRLTTLVDEVNASVENIDYKDVSENIDTTNYYITDYRGKYEMKVNNSNTCYAYLPKNILLKINNGIISYSLADETGQINVNNNDNLKSLSLIGCSNSGVNNVTITKIYSSIF